MSAYVPKGQYDPDCCATCKGRWERQVAARGPAAEPDAGLDGPCADCGSPLSHKRHGPSRGDHPFRAPETPCERCNHVHMDYTDEFCVSCGCEEAVTLLREAEARAAVLTEAIRRVEGLATRPALLVGIDEVVGILHDLAGEKP